MRGRADEALPALAPCGPSGSGPPGGPPGDDGGAARAHDADPGPDADSEDGADSGAWLAEPPEGWHNDLSAFGRLFALLDGWVTGATADFLAGAAAAPPPEAAGDGLAAEARPRPDAQGSSPGRAGCWPVRRRSPAHMLARCTSEGMLARVFTIATATEQKFLSW